MLLTGGILSLEIENNGTFNNMNLLQQQQFSLAQCSSMISFRYEKASDFEAEDEGYFNYSAPGARAEAVINLKFCINANTYCQKNGVSCNQCLHTDTNCQQKLTTLDVVSLTFKKANLLPFVATGSKNPNLTDDILSGTYKTDISSKLVLCSKVKIALQNIFNTSYEGSLLHMHLNAQAQLLLATCVSNITAPAITEPITCKFLANRDDSEKILKAREILMSHYANPITIKELSKKVAMNECYLKKGFKETFGLTIFEFYQNYRMEQARFLLYDKGLNVTEVSVMLGYSSISHFSTAFKKHTGIKPCELLMQS